MTKVLYYCNLALAAFNLTHGVGRIVLGTPHWWVPMLIGLLNAWVAYSMWKATDGLRDS